MNNNREACGHLRHVEHRLLPRIEQDHQGSLNGWTISSIRLFAGGPAVFGVHGIQQELDTQGSSRPTLLR